jgi:molybdopterin/thiamine biosynthesis adenylyltransferase
MVLAQHRDSLARRNLAALGFHNIKAMDFDKLELSNFNRQLLYSEADIGMFKVEMAKERIEEFNPNVRLEITNKKSNLLKM